ncbi:hypothetical protein FB451DRAFT_1176695 [Mycena latifolia]|nr:hypothetical protein FB451DRAFT_1176695 [Mycena latifolia]
MNSLVRRDEALTCQSGKDDPIAMRKGEGGRWDGGDEEKLEEEMHDEGQCLRMERGWKKKDDSEEPRNGGEKKSTTKPTRLHAPDWTSASQGNSTHKAHNPHIRGENQVHGEARENTSGAGDARRRGPQDLGWRDSENIAVSGAIGVGGWEAQAVRGVGAPQRISCGERLRGYALIWARLVPGGTDAGESTLWIWQILGDYTWRLLWCLLSVIFRSSSAADPSAISDADDGGDGGDDDENKMREVGDVIAPLASDAIITPGFRRSSSNWFAKIPNETARIIPVPDALPSCVSYSAGERESRAVDTQKPTECLGTIVRAKEGAPSAPSSSASTPLDPPTPGHDGAPAPRTSRRPPVPTMTPARTSLYAGSQYSSPSGSCSSSRRRPDVTYAYGVRAKQASASASSEWFGESASESEAEESVVQEEEGEVRGDETPEVHTPSSSFEYQVLTLIHSLFFTLQANCVPNTPGAQPPPTDSEGGAKAKALGIAFSWSNA